MKKVKLNLVSGTIQERNLITAFKYNDIKYVVFDGESVGTMGLPVILVSKESLGKVTGITDPDEWKITKDCLKKIIDNQEVEYARLDDELKADDIYFRQLTLPIESFEALKKNYVEPDDASSMIQSDDSPAIDLINQNGITGIDAPIDNPILDPTISPLNPISSVSEPVQEEVAIENTQSVQDFNSFNVQPEAPIAEASYVPQEPSKNVLDNTSDTNYEALKKEFLLEAEKLFDDIYKKINHND